MQAAAILLLATAPVIDAAECARGAAAVGERPSDAIALRQATAPSPSFRLGAAFRAWRNASAAIVHDSSHSTGDGGDEEVLAEDCSDERIAFGTLEAERGALALTVEQVAAAVRLGGAEVTAWQHRPGHPAAPCRR